MQEYCCKNAIGLIFYNEQFNTHILVLESSAWDYYDDCYETVSLIIDYCPFCGQKLIK